MSLPLYYYPDKNVQQCLTKHSYEYLSESQVFVVSFLAPTTPYRGLLLSFQVGTGKTYASVALSHLYNTYGLPVIFLAHNKNTIDNFKKEYESFIIDNQFTQKHVNIVCMGVTKFLSHNPDISNHLVILDEAHNIRENAHRYNKLKDKLNTYDNIKILIITATPMVDQVYEVSSLKSLISEDAHIAYSSESSTGSHAIYKGTPHSTGTYFVSTFKGKQLTEYTYLSTLKTNDIYSKIRQSSLSVSKKYNPHIPIDEQSCKIANMLTTLNHKELTVVFSFFITRGIHFLRDVLNSLGWNEWIPGTKQQKTYAILDGKTKNSLSIQIIETFNNIMNINGSLIAMLIGSSVMNESISLKNVKHVHILTPFWNYGRIRQAIGRTVRMRSHSPSINSDVNIYLHVSKMPNGSSIDLNMYNIAYDKNKKINTQLSTIIKESIWNNKTLYAPIAYPLPDNYLIIRNENIIWDLRKCFDSNKNKISWNTLYTYNAIKYNTDKQCIEYSNIEVQATIVQPLHGTITAWVSPIDKRIRITDLRSSLSRKYMKRGKLIENLTIIELNSISTYLKCSPNITDIITQLKLNNSFIYNQISFRTYK